MTADRPRLSMDRINSMDRDEFLVSIGPVFEGPPWIAEAAWERRPFGSRDELYRALCSVMYSALVAQKEALIRAHPDLVGKAALAGTLSNASASEQASAGLDNLSPEEIEQFTAYNREYRQRFGFPFVVCARENKKESILSGFARRLNNTREQEIDTALNEISKIAYLRLADLVEDQAVDQSAH